MKGTSYTQVAAYRAYVETITAELFTKIFLGFSTASYATLHEGIKGKKVWTEMQIKDLARRYASAFVGTDNVNLKPEILEVVANKVEHREVPQDMEDTYLGFLRRTGFNHQEWPLERYTLMKLIEKLNQEFEIAMWQGEAAASPAATDLMKATFDGFLKKVSNAEVAGDLSPTVLGVPDATNIIDHLRTMWERVSPELKYAGTDIFVSFKQFDNYRINTKERYKVDPAYVEINNSGYRGMRYELGGGNTTIIPVPGMGDSDKILMIPRANLHIGYDSMADWGNFNFEQQVRELLYWMDFKIGCHITLLRDGIAVVNDGVGA